jgi:hypothetical protein
MLPNSIPSNRRTLAHSYNNGSSKHHKPVVLSPRTVLSFLAVAVPCFFLGTISTLYTGVVQCGDYDRHVVLDGAGGGGGSALGSVRKTEVQQQSPEVEADIKARVAAQLSSLQIEMQAHQTATVDGLVEERMAVLMRQHNVNCATAAAATPALSESANVDRLVQAKLQVLQRELDVKCAPAGEKESTLFPIDKVGHFLSGMARTSKEGFTTALDLGVPLDKSINGSSDVLFIYNNKKSLPVAIANADQDMIPDLSMADAMENCDYLNVLLTHHTFGREQCIAIVPQYESYHLQKWMRIDRTGKLDKTQALQKVSRGHQSNGRDQFNPPSLQDTHQNWDMLRGYLDSIHSVLDDLRPILEKIAVKNTVIVMVCNFGQSELLMNFVCSAKARGFDISNIIVFATDQETLDLAESIGLAAYFDQRVRTLLLDYVIVLRCVVLCCSVLHGTRIP